MQDILKLGDGRYIVTSTINALIFKQLQTPLSIGEDIDLKGYQNNITNSFTLQFQTYLEVQ